MVPRNHFPHSLDSKPFTYHTSQYLQWPKTTALPGPKLIRLFPKKFLISSNRLPITSRFAREEMSRPRFFMSLLRTGTKLIVTRPSIAVSVRLSSSLRIPLL